MPVSRRDMWLVVLFAAIVQLVVTAVAIGSPWVTPFCDACREVNFIANPAQAVNLWSPLFTWDAQHYLYLAREWYTNTIASNAFFPLFPGLIALFSAITFLPSSFIALLLSCIASIWISILLFLLVRAYGGNKHIAWTSVVLMQLFPTGFYLHLPYTESLFLSLVLALFLLLKNRPASKSIYLLFFLLVLTRPQGIFVLIPILYAQWQHIVTKQEHSHPSRKWQPLIFTILSAIVAVGTYMCILWLATGSPFSGVWAQQHFVSQNSLGYLIAPWKWVQDVWLTPVWSLHTVGAGSMLNRVFFFVFLGALPLVWKYTPRVLFVYTLAIGGLTAFLGDLVSFPRYLLLLFPIFIALATVMHSKRWLMCFILVCSGISQLLLLHLHSLNYWVA